MARKDYLNAFINNSATIRDVLKSDITDAPHKAVTYDEDGTLIVPAAKGDPALGLILSDTHANYSGVTPAGTPVDVLIKDIGLGIASGEIKKGDLVTTDTDGKLAKAEDGNFIFGVAITAAAADGELVQVQITKGGYKGGAAGSSSPDLSQYQKKITASGILKGDGSGNVTAATADDDYVTKTKLDEKQDKITANGILKGDGKGTITAAVAETDYLKDGSKYQPKQD